MSATIHYAYKKRMRLSPVFKRTQSNPINNIHLGFPRNNPSKPAYVNTPFGGIERENGAFGTHVATVPLFSQTRINVTLFSHTKTHLGAIVRLPPHHHNGGGWR